MECMANMLSGNMANKGCKSRSKKCLRAFSDGLKIQTKKKKSNRNKDNVLHQGPKKSAVPVQKRRHG